MFLRLVVFTVLTSFFLMLIGGSQQAIGLLPEMSLPQWGPGLAALMMLVIFRKDRFKITFFDKTTPLLHYLGAVLIPLGAAAVMYFINLIVKIEPSAASTGMQGSLPLILLWMPLGAVGEELGWRGYLHKKLDGQMNGLLSSLIVGLLWFPIHVSFFGDGPLVLGLLALVIVSYSVVIYALVKESGFSVLLAAVFHLVINLANLPFMDIIHQPAFMLMNALVWVSIAVLTIVMKRDLFFFSPIKAGRKEKQIKPLKTRA